MSKTIRAIAKAAVSLAAIALVTPASAAVIFQDASITSSSTTNAKNIRRNQEVRVKSDETTVPDQLVAIANPSSTVAGASSSGLVNGIATFSGDGSAGTFGVNYATSAATTAANATASAIGSYSYLYNFVLTSAAKFTGTYSVSNAGNTNPFASLTSIGGTNLPTGAGSGSVILGAGTYALGIDSATFSSNASGVSGLSSLSGNDFYSFSISAVPEPAAWAMMIVGFGLVGASMRRLRVQPKINFA